MHKTNSAKHNSFHFNDHELDYVQRKFARYDAPTNPPERESVKRNIGCNGVEVAKSNAEIAEKLGCSKQAISRTCHIAMKKIERRLRILGYEEYLDGEY